ncbi:hypothetical protein AB0A77_26725 [Streptomyces varsoviensis]|uniref:hypothetical protein n=1 Tax=Streptomyces varsoviensis TaxID=67373 RepID=UPI00340CE639
MVDTLTPNGMSVWLVTRYEAMLLENAAEQPEFELITVLARSLPTLLLCELFGFPLADADDLRGWAGPACEINRAGCGLRRRRTHYSPGTARAHAEGEIALGELVNRYPAIRPARRTGEAHRQFTPLLRGVGSLPVRIN